MSSDAPTVLFVPWQPKSEANLYLPSLAGALRECAGIETYAAPPSAVLLPRVLRGRIDVVHVHWIDQLVQARGEKKAKIKARALILQLRMLQKIGKRIVYTAHNLLPHERRGDVEVEATRSLVRIADAIIVHGHVAKDLVCERFGVPPEKVHVIPHPNYIGLYGEIVSRNEARLALDLPDGPMLGFVGQIRPYKGVEELLTAFGEMPQQHLRLLVAGSVRDSDLASRVERAVGEDPRVVFRPGFVPDHQLGTMLSAIDVLVLPYRDVLTSGTALLGMSYAVPCVAPRVGCIPEVLTEDANVLYSLESSLSDALRACLAKQDQWEAMGEQSLEQARKFTWRGAAEITANVYRDCGLMLAGGTGA